MSEFIVWIEVEDYDETRDPESFEVDTGLGRCATFDTREEAVKFAQGLDEISLHVYEQGAY
jgi:hypothetical protein